MAGTEMSAYAEVKSTSKRHVRAGHSFVMMGEHWRLRARRPVASMPWSVTVSADGKSVYVAHVGVGKRHRDNVWRIDADTLEVRARSAFRGHAAESALIRNDTALLVSNSRTNQLMELDARTLKVHRRIATAKVPKHFVVTAHGDGDDRGDKARIFVANWDEGAIEIISMNSGERVALLPVGRHARGVALSPQGERLYAMNFGEDSISVIDTAEPRVLRTSKACRAPRHGVLVAGGKRLLVTCHEDAALLDLDADTLTVRRRIPVDLGPKTVIVNRDERYAIVAAEAGNALSIVELATGNERRIELPARGPCGVALAPDGTRLYVTARSSHELLVFERV